MQDMTNTDSLPLFYGTQDVTFLLILHYVWLIISILLQYHIEKLSGYF